jgi:uncharacterized protein (DUF302 family)
MTTKRLFTALFWMVMVVAVRPVYATEMMEVYSQKIEFADVRDNLAMAITGRGLVISSISHVGEMLERTGKDLGASTRLYKEAEIYEFCSAVLSRKMMEADRRNIAFCPFAVSIYVLPDEPEKVYAAFRRPAIMATPDSTESLNEAEEMLRGIAREALELD